MRSNKKGFTIVELVIVIAVIAILAAVLIPTIAGLVRKANISADTVVAKQLNNAIATQKVDDFEDALAVLRENGYLIANLNAKADQCYFAWDATNKQIVLVDAKNGYEIIYNNKDVDEANLWYAVSDPAIAKTLREAGKNVKNTVASTNDLKATIDMGGKITIYLDESVVVTTDDRIVLNDENAEITLNFNGSNLASEGTIADIPVEIIKGKLNVENAVIGASGDFTNEHGSFSTAIGYDGNAKLFVQNSTITGKGNAISGANYNDGPAEVKLENCNVYSDNVGFNMSTPGTAELKDTNIECPNPIFASFGANITIDGGKYVSTTDCLVELHDNTTADKPTTVTIKSGDFTFNTLVIKNGQNIQLVIEGGMFNCATMGWDDLKAYVADGATITLNGVEYTK